jgi:hypothetical protein
VTPAPAQFVSVDPGLAKVGGSGWALWQDGRLVDADVLRNRKEWLTVPQRVAGQKLMLLLACGFPHQVVCESMVQRYGRGAGKVPPQDLIDLNLLAGHLGDVWVTPGEWKGSVPRDVEQVRSRAALDEAERAIVEEACVKLPKSVHKEVWSAVGIGLSVAGRAHKRCGWPG